ncbi:MAG: hypothetical protein ACRBHB_20845 [Arenicella sp.]
MYGSGSSTIDVLTISQTPQEYEQARKVFNRRFDLMPWAIVFPETNLGVSQMLALARACSH